MMLTSYYFKKCHFGIWSEVPQDSWIFEYFVYTLTEFSKVEIRKGSYEAACQWWPVNELPTMMFNHAIIIAEALKALRLHIAHFPLGIRYCPKNSHYPKYIVCMKLF